MRAGFACLLLAATALSSAGYAQPSGEQTGELTAQAPRASFDIQLEAGQVVTLTASGEVDTILTLYGPDGRELAQNDDVAQGDLSSRIIHAATEAGRYRAVVTGYGDATGSFTFERTDGVDFDLSWQARVIGERPVSLARGRTEVRIPVDLAADDIFVASTFALTEDLDTTLTLLDARGETVAENDDRGDGTLNSQIAYQPSQGGRYAVVVGSFSGDQSGDLIVSTAIDPNAVVPFDLASVERTPFETDSGEITNEEPSKTYRFELEAGQTLLAAADAVDEALDPVLRLEGADGLPVAMNDDRGDGSLNSAIAFTAPADGVYTLEVSGYGTTLGGFTMEASLVDASVVDTLQTVFEGRVVLSGPEQMIETPNFRVRYTLEGDDATTEAFARLTADRLQEAYTTQVTELGFAAPIPDADGRYRAYVAEAGDAMGYAKPLQMLFDNPATPVREELVARGMLVIDNDLAAGRSETAEGLMRATVDHEFGHLVQYGYDAEEGLSWLYESTSSWIETVTAGEDEDASRYAETDFASPQLCWTTAEPGHDYGQWTLLQSLADVHGPGIVPRLWENAAAHDGFATMSETLTEVGTTIPDAIRAWRIQNFARDYDLAASRFSWSVAQGGQLKRVGTFSAGVPIEQLGASYLEVRIGGPRRYVLNDGDGLEMIGLGVREGQVEVTPLGRDGVFDRTSYDYAAVMVFNNAVPDRPGDCEGVDYEIEISAATSGVSPFQSRVDGSNFLAPGATSPDA